MPHDRLPIQFTNSGLIRGFKICLPIAVSVFCYGTVFGVLAGQAGIPVLQTIAMSGWVFAGAAQFVALEIWQDPVPVGSLVFTTIIVNLRHILMGAAVRPRFEGLSPLPAYGTLFFMTDENWALSMDAFEKGERDAAFLLGSGLAIYLSWLFATALGRLGGAFLADPARYGLDFAFTAVFLTLLAGSWQGRRDGLPWLAAAVAAGICLKCLPGKWYILAAGLAAGAAAGCKTAQEGGDG